MRRTWLFAAVLTPVLFAALPLATVFFAAEPGPVTPDLVTVTVTTVDEDESLAMRPAPEPQRDCSYESNLRIEG